MSNRPTTLIFLQLGHFFPAGAPLDTWEVISDSNSAFEVESSGRLIRKEKFDGSRWVSKDFTGSFTVSITPRYSDTALTYMLFVVCGVVKHMHQVEMPVSAPLLSGNWRWVLEALVVDRQAVESATTYRGCLQMIQLAERDPSYKTGDFVLDAMIGMALCRPALIEGKTPRNALECLSEHQIRAVTGWLRATIND
uniref:Uncharacterized protein n=1 Tax=Pseudomonas fluorescens (strain SBW25) TaxID=216595 RepID=A0A0G4E474_PSEFS|nr:hypothetical protein [Pseudomonas fluorescens]CEK41974.1 hypothetical protein PQBR57_0021 [Pseudomonas fluorescens SBW25]